MGSCRARSVYLTTGLLDRLSPLNGLTSIVHVWVGTIKHILFYSVPKMGVLGKYQDRL